MFLFFKSHFDRAEPERFVAETRARLFERSEFLARRSKPLRLGYPKGRSNGCLFFCILFFGANKEKYGAAGNYSASSAHFLPRNAKNFSGRTTIVHGFVNQYNQKITTVRSAMATAMILSELLERLKKMSHNNIKRRNNNAHVQH